MGHAPMSYDQPKSIREQGIRRYRDPCGEYCDLHQIEKNYGFEVYYLPVQDDKAPALQEVEKTLEWMDEAIYLGKKILVHCRFGIGRTGTFVTSYLLRRGFSLRLAKAGDEEDSRPVYQFQPVVVPQKIRKKEGNSRSAAFPGRQHAVNLSPHFEEYDALIKKQRLNSMSLPTSPGAAGDTMPAVIDSSISSSSKQHT